MPTPLRYLLLVTGPAYGTQQASSAYQFAQALLKKHHVIEQIFFYREGVYNANQLTSPASDEFDLVRAWHTLAQTHHIPLNLCVSAALRRGISQDNAHPSSLLSPAFQLSGLGELAQALLSCERVMQF